MVANSKMKKFTVLCAVVLMVLVLLAPVGCQQSTPDVVEVISIFKAESGAPPPTGAWAYDRKIDPHPDRIQRVFNLGDRMYLGLRISEQLETDITFSRYTFFNRDTGEEVEAGLPGDLGPFELGRATLAGFQNPWMVPADPGNYELRVYLDNTVIASARFEVSPKTTRQPVVMVKSQLTGGRSGQSSGFIFRSNGHVLTFLADASEIERLEVVLGNGLPLEASVSRTDNTTSLASIKIEANNYLVPFTLAGNHEVAELKTGTHLVAAGYSYGEYREIEAEVVDTKYDLPLSPGTTLPVVKLDAGGEPGMAGGPVVNAAGHVVGVMLAVDPKTGESFMMPLNRIPSVLFLPPPSPPSTSDIQPISREQAVETATRGLPPSIVARSDIRAEVHGWYWEVIFDNLNAKADELRPYPLKPPPPAPAGQPPSEPYPGIWQSVIATVDTQTGDLKSMGARQAPEPGPYVSEEQAISSAQEYVKVSLYEEAWIENASVEAYLRGDTWIVLFWEEGASAKDSRALDVHRFRVSVDAVTGVAHGASRG